MADVPRGFYTPAKLATLRDNLARYDWAQTKAAAITKAADAWVALGDEQLRVLVPPPSQPRAYTVHASGCPIHGEQAHLKGRYSWGMSPTEPYRIICPAGGESYPNADYPDDGWGYTRPGEPKKFWFKAYWAHWSGRNYVVPAIRDCSQAYLITGDAKYARPAIVLLSQLAEYYPDYNYETQSRYGTEFQSTYYGRLLYHTWETFTVTEAAAGYDAVKPAIGDAALRQRIETRLLRTMAADILGTPPRIQGNYGMHQVGLLRLAATLRGTPGEPDSDTMVDWVLRHVSDGLYTSMGFEDALYNLVQRDGTPFESPGYNLSWVTNLNEVAEALGDAGVDVFGNPRLRKLFTWPLKLAVAGQFTPALGDSSNMFSAVMGFQPGFGEPAVRHYADPAYARAILGQRGDGGLFQPSLAELVEDAAKAHPEPVGVTSSLLPAMGCATLQTGDEGARMGASLFYGWYVGHRHVDRMQLDLFAHGHSLLPDFGYPETADAWDPRRFGFFGHTVSHNTVMVDAKRQADTRGRLEYFVPGKGIQALSASATGTYPGVVSRYRRTLVLVDAAPEQAYLVDLFAVAGGQQHDYLLHSTQADFASSLPLSPPRAGTLAGPDVPYGQFYDDPKLKDAPVGTVTYGGYAGSGFQWLFNVQQAPLAQAATVDWHLTRPAALPESRDPAGIVLRAHLLGDDETVFAADGKPQLRQDWPETVKFVIRRRTGDELVSNFVTVFEPYRDTPFLRTVRRTAHDGRIQLEVTCADGAVHTLTCDPATGALQVITPARQLTVGGADLGWQATVAAVDYQHRRLRTSVPLPAALPGNLLNVAAGDSATVVEVVERLGGDQFGVGDDDLMAGRAAVRAAEGNQVTVESSLTYWKERGMTLVNEADQPVGRLTDWDDTGKVWQVAGRPLTLDDFSDADGDGRRQVRLAVVGPGDTLVTPGVARED